MNQQVFLHSLPDFLEIQRLSFLWFLICGLKKPLSKFPLCIYTDTARYLINPSKYYFKLSSATATTSKLDDLTYCFEVYLTLRKSAKEIKIETSKLNNYKNFYAHFYSLKKDAQVAYLKVKSDQIKAELAHIYSEKIRLRKKQTNLNDSEQINSITIDSCYNKVCIGEVPLMSDDGSFVINGTERTVINQMIRSPGISFHRSLNNLGSMSFSASIISESGAWLKVEFFEQAPLESAVIDGLTLTANDVGDRQFWVTLDKGQGFPLAFLLIAFGLDTRLFAEMSRHPEYAQHILLNYDQIYSQTDVISLMYQSLLEEEEDNVDSLLSGVNSLNSFFYHCKYFYIGSTGRHRLNQHFYNNLPSSVEYITPLDLVCLVDGIIDLQLYVQSVDEIDNLSNKRIRATGNTLQEIFRVGLDRLIRHIIENKYVLRSLKNIELFDVFDPRFISSSFKEFFTTSELSQFLDNINPLADLTHKRRVTVLGLDGISADNASIDIRDIHSTHYGRLCPIETPEGQNAGLVTTLAMCSQLNFFGFLETPYFFCKNGRAYINQKPRFVDAKLESSMAICSSDVYIDKSFDLGISQLPIRVGNSFYLLNPTAIEFLSISPLQLFSIATSLVPFFEHNDANRVLMGANMQRQAVPLLNPHKPIVGTGMEFLIAYDSGFSLKSYTSGVVSYSSSEKITIFDTVDQKITYLLRKYLRTNNDTCINQKPLVWVGETVYAGQVIADGPAISGAELSLGRNLLLAYMPWEGYNFEDAVIISENVVKKDLLTSIHIEEYQTEIHETALGPERITSTIRTVSRKNRRHLAKNGLVREGAYVRSGDILVGKVTPIEEDKSPESRILRAIFGKNITYRYKDNSLALPHGCEGRVIDVRMLPKLQLIEEDDGSSITAIVRIYVAQTRKIVTGDKVAGRHGNKGVISKILPVQDMPYLPDGTPVDILFNPLGVPSRMNVGQLFECLLGFAGEKLQRRFKVLPFDETYGKEASRIFVNQKLKQAAVFGQESWLLNSSAPGKILLRDGRTGEFFDNPVFVGRSYILKLMHLVDDKIHARATGPYSLITQQPLGGRSQNGGQRFGEMEVWALQAYGAAFTLQEFLTIRSDDIDGRNNTFDAMIHGRMPSCPQIPEAFNVLTKELRALGLDLITVKLDNDSFSLELFEEVDMLVLFEEKLGLQYKHSHLNPRTRILSQLHNDELYDRIISINESK